MDIFNNDMTNSDTSTGLNLGALPIPACRTAERPLYETKDNLMCGNESEYAGELA